MAILYLICGMAGSGKTTLARKLEASCAAIRMCPDEWISSIIKDKNDKEELERLRDPVEQLLWNFAQKLLANGVDIILENGFWSREERMKYLQAAKGLKPDVKVVLQFLDIPIESIYRRVQNRNSELPSDCFQVTKEDLDLWMTWFVPPDTDELTLYDEYRIHSVSSTMCENNVPHRLVSKTEPEIK